MPRHIRNRFLILAALTLAGLVLALPSVKTALPPWLQKIRFTDGMRLGLDLQGGMHLILKVDVDKAVRHQTEMALTDLRDSLRKARLSVQVPVLTADGRIRIAFDDAGTLPPVRQLLNEQFPGL